MKVSDAMESAYSDQVTLELWASISYLQISAWFESKDLPGMASWMRIQSGEEIGHALRFMDFLLARGNSLTIGTVESPKPTYGSAKAAFEAALEQERTVTKAIRELYAMASKEKDAESFPLLDWFLTEQVEEEDSVQKIVGQLRLAGQNGSALLMLDRELGARKPVAQ
ncbi:MAG: ferritin [Acidimicrobiia bacterium]|nr:ferritin [Acidimicrobiia bacterium]MDQ3501314.1 ferritin [Actinomycetota bacterium]